MPSQRQIAKLCNLSPMTVSAVLNNRSGEYSEETRERVLQAVRQIGYRPRAAARTERTKTDTRTTARTIGIAVPYDYGVMIASGYFGEIFRAILTATHRLGVDVLFTHGSIYFADSFQSIRTHFDGHCDGLLCVAPFKSAPLVAALRERGYPCVLVGDTGDFPDQSFVDVDHAAGIGMAMAHLLGLGHRRIGFVGGPDTVRSANARHDSYKRELEIAGIAYDPHIVQVGAIRAGEHYQFVAQLVQQKDSELPTAFLCWNDVAAHRTITALQDAGKFVPEQVSVIGFDDATVQVQGQPQLTTIRQPYRKLGETAVQTLADLIENPGCAKLGKLIAPSLILRDSTSPVETTL